MSQKTANIQIVASSDEWPFLKRFLPVTLVLCFGTILSAIVFWQLRSVEHKEVAKAFKLAAEDRARMVKNTFDTEVAMAQLLRAALVTDGRIERQEFHEILEPFLTRTKSIYAVEWVPRVPDSRRKEYEEAAIRDGIKDFQFRELGADGKLQPASNREEYFPIYFIAPQRNKIIYGFDCGSETVRLKAIELARDTGKIVASGKFSFLDEKGNQEGFFVALPVYERGKQTDTLAHRRQYFNGVILGLFKPNDMIQAAMEKLQTEGIDVGMYDASDGEKSLFYYPSRTRDPASDPLDPKQLLDKHAERYTIELGTAGQPWTIVCTPTPKFKAKYYTKWPAVSFIIGMVFTGLVAGYLYRNIGLAAELEQKVAEQTREIREAQEDLLYRLASVSQWRGDETAAHVRRVGLMSQALARADDWFGEELEAIRLAAPLHDIGKIAIPDAILMKTEKLSAKESKILKDHTRIGAEILAGSTSLMMKMAREIAASHHERWDGNGYPAGLSGNAIPESARIVAIVDTFDVLTHGSQNCPAMSEAEAIAMMEAESDKQFDPRLLAIFIKNIATMRKISERFPDTVKNAAYKGLTTLEIQNTLAGDTFSPQI